MFSRLSQGVSSVLQEFSGEERSDGDVQDGLVPQVQPDPEASLEGPAPSEEVLERLAQTEQLVVQLKELIREKDGQLASTEKQHKEEKEQAEVKFTKLKLQAKAKMAALNKQITELKGQEALNSTQNSESSFQVSPGVEEELQQLKEKLSQAESSNKILQHQLWEAEQRVREEGHAEQVRILQAVVKEKDVRFQEQILKHEQELLSLTQASNDPDLQQALRTSQQRIEELEESLRSRSEVLEMLQQELNSADQQKQILTAQFRQMELELAEAQRLREEDGQQWVTRAEEELAALRNRLEASEREKDQTINSLNTELTKKTTQLDEMREKLGSEEKEKEEALEKFKDRESGFEAELAQMKACLEARLETSESDREQIISALNVSITQLNAELMKKATELEEMREQLESQHAEREEMLEKFKERETGFEVELTDMKVSLEARLETSDQTISALNDELLKKTAEVNETKTRLEFEEKEREKMVEKFKEKETSFEAELANLKLSLEARLETAEGERDQTTGALNDQLLKKMAEMDEMRAKLESAESEKDRMQESFKERETNFEAMIFSMKESLEASLETTKSEKEQTISALNVELLKKTTELESISAEKSEVLVTLQEKQTSFERELSDLLARMEDTEKQKEEMSTKLEVEVTHHMEELQHLQEKLYEVEKAREEESKSAKDHLSQMQDELESLREALDANESAHEAGIKTKDVLEKLWRRIQSLMATGHREEEISIPADPAEFLELLPALEAHLCNLNDEQNASQARISHITLTLQSLQGQLDRSTAEREDTEARIQDLQQQLLTVQPTDESLGANVTDLSVRDLERTQSDHSRDGHRSENEFQTDQILFLEQQLADRERELFALRERLAGSQTQHIAEEESADGVSRGDSTGLHNSTTLSDVLEGSQEEETTLVAVDTSGLSVSADNEISPELIVPQPESPGESKGTSSDEMVTSSDSEVAHSSWTLLEAVNQDGTQEWPVQVQDFASLRLSTQSWEETCEEQVTSSSCIVDIESPSVVISETVHVHHGQQEGSLLNTDLNIGQNFAQVLAEEIQKRYSELLEELQQFKDTALQSREKTLQLEEMMTSLTVSKNEAESRANVFEMDLIEAKAMIEQEKLHGQSVAERFENFKEEVCFKNDTLQTLQADLDKAQQRLVEQEGQARMLTAQLEDRELASSELEQKLMDMEGRLVQITQEADIAKAALIDRTAHLEELQNSLSQKDQEMMELNDSLTTKLLQAGEEKYAIASEAKKLKEQINELEIIRDDQQNILEDKTAESEELVSLRKENEDLVTQMAAMKKDGEQIKRKLQAALIQRKELLKKVSDFEKEVESKEEKEGGDNERTIQLKNAIKEKELEIQRLDSLLQETRCQVNNDVKEKDLAIQHLDSLLQETKDILNLKEETLKSLEQKIANHDEALTESHAEIQHLTKKYIEMNEQMSQVSDDKNRLLSQIALMESDIETLQKKLQDAIDAHEDAVVKAEENASRVLEQLKQQKGECSDVLERLQSEEVKKTQLLNRIAELEGQLESKIEKQVGVDVEENVGPKQIQQKPDANDWVQEEWVDFASGDTETQQLNKPSEQFQQPMLKDNESIINALQEQLRVEQAAHSEIEVRLQESQSSQSLTECKYAELCKELETLREKERQRDALSGEMEALRDTCQRAEADATKLKVELDEAWEAAKRSVLDAENPMKALQSEVNEFKVFLKNKNDEIDYLSQQLGEQSSLLLKMQETVLEKDQLIASLQEGLKAEQDRVHKLKSEMPQREEEEKDNSAKLQQLQRKLQAALVSRKEALKEKQALKEEQAAAEKIKLELQQRLELIQVELNKSREEKEKLIEEVDRTLLENQSLSASCESLKLAMEGVLNEKDACKRQAEGAKEEFEQVCKQLEDKVQSMKEEYESLLKSYENVSDEAERVRRVLEAARQERQELAAKARIHEAAKQEAERLAEEAAKEVDTVKEKMRKFAKVKHQKIMDLEEENERLRDQEDKKLTKHTETELKQELERVEQELETLKISYNVAIEDKHALEKKVGEFRPCLAQENDTKGSETLDTCSMGTITEVKVLTQQRSPDIIETQECQNDSFNLEANLIKPVESVATTFEQNVTEEQAEMTAQTEEKLNELVTSLKTAENKIRQLESDLEHHEESKTKLESMLNAEIASLKQSLQESIEKEGLQREESSKKEAQLQEICASLEAERDDLEERLMNQLAQLNGSIAGYQQEASDSRDRFIDLQRKLEQLERERAELETELANEKDRAARMEEDMRQAQRERAEAETEAGRQRELEQKLKSAQRVKEGSQNRTRQLEELLREKQLEVRQLQKDCIEYQERISELCKEVKSLLLGKDELSAELEAARMEIAKTIQDRARIASELSTCKGKLDITLEEAKQAQADILAAEQMIQRKEAELKADAERTLDEVRYRLGAELKQIELRLEKSYREREREEEATLEARSVAEAADRHAQEMQARLDEALARLAAFSRSMSSLQDDRDRVLDEAKQWESRFHTTLQEKEADVRDTEARAKQLAEQLQREINQKEELQNLLERMQKEEENLQVELSDAKKKHKESLEDLEKERRALQEKLTLVESDLTQTHSLLTTLEVEAEGLRHRTKAQEEAVDKLQSDASEARAVIKERDTEERRLCLRLEQLETDLRASKNLTETLQAALDEKEKREMELLGEKEQAVTQAVEEARKDADGRAEMAEKELEERRGELRGLEERLRKAEGDIFQSRAQLESFTKAMGSLQDDRDRVLSQYKQLEERHLQVMMEKDNLIQEAAGENNGLKEELRALLAQRDDLNAENAKLAAQLHGYRNDLNQVLAMKDSQHKQILAAQVERIGFLEREKDDLERHICALEKDVAQVKVPLLEQEVLSQASEPSIRVNKQDSPGAEVEKLREQLQAARKNVTTLEETLELEKETQAVNSKELKELRWEVGILRTEAETAEERVAELARDLLRMEQQLLEEKEAAGQIRAQNQSFGQAMASLQDARDQAVNEAKELHLHLDGLNRTTQPAPPPVGSKGEVWSLKNALAALQNDRERMLEQLHLQRSELDRLGSGELSRLTQALEEEKRRAEEQEERAVAELSNKDSKLNVVMQELEMLRFEQMDWQGQAELLKQQTLTTLSDRDHQIRQLTAMLEEAQASKFQHEHTQRQGSLAVDTAPGGPLEHMEGYKAEYIELQRRLDEESEQRLRVEEQLIVAQDHLKRYTQGEWHTSEASTSETSVLIEPQEGAVTRTRSGGPGFLRMLRVAFCSRQRTPLLVSLYLLTVHVLLLLCMGGYL